MERAPDPLRERIERAAEGLVYSTASNRPFEFRRFPGVTIPVGRLSPTELASLAGARGGEVLELSFDEFLARHIEPAGPGDAASLQLVSRYQALRDAIRESLHDLRVVRHGRGEVRCIVVGNDPTTGEVVAVETTSADE